MHVNKSLHEGLALCNVCLVPAPLLLLLRSVQARLNTCLVITPVAGISGAWQAGESQWVSAELVSSPECSKAKAAMDSCFNALHALFSFSLTPIPCEEDLSQVSSNRLCSRSHVTFECPSEACLSRLPDALWLCSMERLKIANTSMLMPFPSTSL